MPPAAMAPPLLPERQRVMLPAKASSLAVLAMPPQQPCSVPLPACGPASGSIRPSSTTFSNVSLLALPSTRK